MPVLGHRQVTASLSEVYGNHLLLAVWQGLLDFSFSEASQDLPIKYMHAHPGCGDGLRH